MPVANSCAADEAIAENSCAADVTMLLIADFCFQPLWVLSPLDVEAQHFSKKKWTPYIPPHNFGSSFSLKVGVISIESDSECTHYMDGVLLSIDIRKVTSHEKQQ